MSHVVLLTGIGGSIGCHMMAHIFHDTNWTICGIDSFRHKGLTDRVEQMLCTHPEWRSRLRIYTHDLTAPISNILAKKIGHVDYVINMAARSDVSSSIEEPESFILNNVQIALTMFEYAKKLSAKIPIPKGYGGVVFEKNKSGLKAFVQISTDEVYGPSGENLAHSEWSPIIPSNPYSASKAAQEAIAISYWRSYDVPLIITNTMNNFGEMQQHNKFPAMVQSKVMKGETVTIHGEKNNIGSRYYLHSRNFADALIFILKNTTPYMHKDGEVDRPDRYNIVGDRRLNNLEMAQMVAGVVGKPLKYEFKNFHAVNKGHDRHYGLDGKKLAKLGWQSPKSLEESMADTIDWQLKHPEWLNA